MEKSSQRISYFDFIRFITPKNYSKINSQIYWIKIIIKYYILYRQESFLFIIFVR